MLAGFSFWALRTGEFGFTVGTPLAVALVLRVRACSSRVVIELAVFRPLRTAAPLAKLVASLGVLLMAQASMLLAFGTSQHPAADDHPDPGRSACSTRRCRCPPSSSAASVVAMTVALWALYRWTRFGLATRAASENDVAARLAGLSPNELSLANTLLASLLLGTLGILAGSVAALDTTTLPFLVVPALAAALFARLTSFAIACALRARHRHARVADRVRVDEVVVPDQPERGLAGRQGAARLRAHRRGDVPARRVAADARRARRAAPPRRASPEARGHARDPVDAPVRDRARRAAVRLPPGADELADRDRDGPLAGRHHRLRRPDLGRPARARRRRRLHGLASRRRRRHRLPAGAARGRRRRRAARPRDRGLGAARARRGPRRRHDRRRGGRLQLRLRQPHLGRGRDRLAGAGSAPLRHQPRADRVVPRPRRQPAEPRVRLGRARRDGRPRPARRLGAARHARPAHARGPLERARRGRRRDRRPERQADRVRHQRAHRRRRGHAVRVQLRLGERRPLQRARWPSA